MHLLRSPRATVLTHCVFSKWSFSVVSNIDAIVICTECGLILPVGSENLPVGSFNFLVSLLALDQTPLHVMVSVPLLLTTVINNLPDIKPYGPS